MKFLFVINGLGLGNSTRCEPIIDLLEKGGHDLHLATSGNGLFYYEGNNNLETIYELKTLKYGTSKDGFSLGPGSWWAILLAIS